MIEVDWFKLHGLIETSLLGDLLFDKLLNILIDLILLVVFLLFVRFVCSVTLPATLLFLSEIVFILFWDSVLALDAYTKLSAFLSFFVA